MKEVLKLAELRYRYVGQGDYHNGVPARDLDQDDLDGLDEAQLELVRQRGGLYEPARAAPVAKVPKEEVD